jgi:two-component system alkaline phosphatase synthesis response regulator PhoP
MPDAKRILAVDDEQSIRNLVSITLRNRGFIVETAVDGDEAVDKAKLLNPDLIVLDVMMPKMNGWQVRKVLRDDPVTRDIPIIILSAVGEFEAQLQGMQSENDDYLTKPFSPAELGDMVESMFDPSKREKLAQQHKSKQAKLRTIVDIMHRSHDAD